MVREDFGTNLQDLVTYPNAEELTLLASVTSHRNDLHEKSGDGAKMRRVCKFLQLKARDEQPSCLNDQLHHPAIQARIPTLSLATHSSTGESRHRASVQRSSR